MDNKQLNIILLMGPTATGKTALAIDLAASLTVEIINVDSALIYTDMNIGTAKPTPSELLSVPHHLINIINPLQSYSVAEFIHECNNLIVEISARGRTPLLVGGTMMYFNALINGINELPKSDNFIRDKLITQLHTDGVEELYNELLKVDADAASRIMPSDAQRIIRALEVFYITGYPLSKLHQQTKQIKLADNIKILPLMIVPNNREELHYRINHRFLGMLNNGLIEEVVALRTKYPNLTCNHSSMRCVGYYQVWQFLDKVISYQELIDMGSAATRQLAKRQITWLKKMNGINLNDNSNKNKDLSLASLKQSAIEKIHLII